MKKILFLIFIFNNSLINEAGANSIEKFILKTIAQTKHERENLGLIIEEDGKIIYGLNEKKQFVPASLTKIITANALLSQIPLNTKFTTVLKSDAEIKGRTLTGDLCFEGGGDPSFVSEKMWYLVNEFRRTGVEEVKGDLIIDSSRFDKEVFDEGRGSTRVDRAYDAPISATSFNWNSLNIYIRPTSPGQPVEVILDPENSPFKVKNLAKTSKKNGIKSIAVERKGDDLIVVDGLIGEDVNELVFYKSVSNPEKWTGGHLQNFLFQRGIKIKGSLKYSNCSQSAKVLASAPSKNYNEMVADTLKFSNNFVAEMLVKNMGAIKGIKPASMNDGIEEIKKHLDSLEIKRNEYVLANVSGLTRENRFNVFQLNFILKNSLNDFRIYPEFVSGLAISGIDGTLKSRLKKYENPPMIRAKTGYLDGVVGLAGYLERKNKSPLVFTFLYNGGYEKALAARDLFDSILVFINDEKNWK